MPPQRWRLTVRRDAIAAALAQRDVLLAWEAALRDSGLLPWPPEWLVRPPVAPPTAPSPGIRVTQPKLVMAAPLPSRMTADRELVDLYLPERVRLHDLRSRLELHLPPGHELVDLYDVWLGSPALPGLVVAADYRVTVSPAGSGLGPVPEGSRPDEASPSPSAHETDAALIAEVIQAILAAADVPRVRGSASRAPVNLRPLIIEVRCAVRADEDSIAAPVAGSAPPASAPA
ncbi:MAG TPA: DUF2344 domain-containing protein, partial [Candidatus Saccharimonadales bacterium]|nr:DUF2344 domain-containing protein [Candidatus Saccharimonadales bacterium]